MRITAFGKWDFRIDTTQNKDGQPEFLTGELYAKHFKVFADSMRQAAAELGVNDLYRCGYGGGRGDEMGLADAKELEPGDDEGAGWCGGLLCGP